MKIKREYDFIVVGSGASGSMVVHTISNYFTESFEKVSILCIERGMQQHTQPTTYSSEGIGKTFSTTNVYTEEKSKGQKGLFGRKVMIKQGNLEGGLTSGNGGVAVPGDKTDYQDWPKGWQWDDLSGGLKRISRKFKLQPVRRNTLFDMIKYEATENHGHNSLTTDDIAEGTLNGIGYENMYVDNRTRSRKSAAQVLLRPVIRKNGNVDLLTNTKVLNINFHKKCDEDGERSARSITVENVLTGFTRDIKIRHKLILCAGAVETPRILLRSGVGNKKKVSCKCIIENKNVGRGLQDQVGFPLLFKVCKEPKVSTCYSRSQVKALTGSSSCCFNWIAFCLGILFGIALGLITSFCVLKITGNTLSDWIFQCFLEFILGTIMAFITIYLGLWGVLLGLVIYCVCVIGIMLFIGVFTGETLWSVIVGTLIFNIFHVISFFIGFYFTVFWISVVLHWNRDGNNSLLGLQLWSYRSNDDEDLDEETYKRVKKFMQVKRKKKELKIQMYFQTGYYFGDFLPGAFINSPQNNTLRSFTRWFVWIIVKISLAKYWLFSRMVNVIVTVARPLSRGYVDLECVNPNYLSNKRDIEDLKYGVREVRRIMNGKLMRCSFCPREFIPKYGYNGCELERMIVKNARTIYHLVGTCRMGEDPCKSVVNSKEDLNIHGVSNVHIMDSSVFPSITSSSNSLIIMRIAERATERMLRKVGIV